MKIVKYPHPALRHAAKPVASIDKDVQMVAGQMLELMYKAEGLGLAAPQVDFPFQLLVMNFEGDPEKKEMEYVAINPVIVESKGTLNDREGCLSFPGMQGMIPRPTDVTVKATTLEGEPLEFRATGLLARAVQHEHDHLHGILFIDRMEPADREATASVVEKLLRRNSI